MNSNTRSENETRGRSRISRACDVCNRRKVKCDGKRPSCSGCYRMGLECTYERHLKKRGPKSKYEPLSSDFSDSPSPEKSYINEEKRNNSLQLRALDIASIHPFEFKYQGHETMTAPLPSSPTTLKPQDLSLGETLFHRELEQLPKWNLKSILLRDLSISNLLSTSNSCHLSAATASHIQMLNFPLTLSLNEVDLIKFTTVICENKKVFFDLINPSLLYIMDFNIFFSQLSLKSVSLPMMAALLALAKIEISDYFESLEMYKLSIETLSIMDQFYPLVLLLLAFYSFNNAMYANAWILCKKLVEVHFYTNWAPCKPEYRLNFIDFRIFNCIFQKITLNLYFVHGFPETVPRLAQPDSSDVGSAGYKAPSSNDCVKMVKTYEGIMNTLTYSRLSLPYITTAQVSLDNFISTLSLERTSWRQPTKDNQQLIHLSFVTMKSLLDYQRMHKTSVISTNESIECQSLHSNCLQFCEIMENLETFNLTLTPLIIDDIYKIGSMLSTLASERNCYTLSCSKAIQSLVKALDGRYSMWKSARIYSQLLQSKLQNIPNLKSAAISIKNLIT